MLHREREAKSTEVAITNHSRKNEVAEPKWKKYLVVDMFGGESKV